MKHASSAMSRQRWIGLSEDDANQAPKAHYFGNVLRSRRGDRSTSQ
jgi:hypothetical protein